MQRAARALLTQWKGRGLILLGVLLVVIAGVGGIGWYYSGVLKDGALVIDHAPSRPDLELVAIEEGRVTLAVTPRAKEDGPWTKAGLWGLERANGYDQVGAILEINDREVTREFFGIMGSPRVGEMVRLDSYAFTGDPQTALGLPFQEVSFSSPLGDFPAWFVDGSRSTWAIFVHGRDANREEALRMLPTVVDLGFPSLIITYRNDEGTPGSPDGFYQFGETEWEELEAAAKYALEQGAEELVLVGYSMGGAIVTNFLYQSSAAGRVLNAILDAPLLSFEALIDFQGRRRGLPGPLTWLGKSIAGFRFDIDWGARDYLSRADELPVPILLFHGEADDKVPIKSSDRLAEARPDIVTYIRVPDATHVRSWNMDPDAYETAVRNFLQALA